MYQVRMFCFGNKQSSASLSNIYQLEVLFCETLILGPRLLGPSSLMAHLELALKAIATFKVPHVTSVQWAWPMQAHSEYSHLKRRENANLLHTWKVESCNHLVGGTRNLHRANLENKELGRVSPTSWN